MSGTLWSSFAARVTQHNIYYALDISHIEIAMFRDLRRSIGCFTLTASVITIFVVSSSGYYE